MAKQGLCQGLLRKRPCQISRSSDTLQGYVTQVSLFLRDGKCIELASHVDIRDNLPGRRG
jgi:hypothetical protein